MSNAPSTIDISISTEGLPNSAQIFTVRQYAGMNEVLAMWAQANHVDPYSWCLVVRHGGTQNVRTFSSFSYNKTISDVFTPDDTLPITITSCFRRIDLPQAIAPLRFAACIPPPTTQRASPDAIETAFFTQLGPTILPFVLSCPLDAARTALVCTSWKKATATNWLFEFRLGKYFPTTAHTAAARSVLEKIQRPSPAAAAALSEEYKEDITGKDDMGFEFEERQVFFVRAGKLAGLPYTFVWRECSIHCEGCTVGNVMLTVGEMPAGSNRLRYTELFSYIGGEDEGSPRLNLDAFLPLRAQLRERFPAAAQLSDMQLLLLLTCATVPWPVDLNDKRIYDAYDHFYGSPILCTIASLFAHVEQMPGHPDTPRVPERDGVPSGMEEDNSLTGGRGYIYIDGLPIASMAPTESYLAAVEAKLALVTQFHVGEAD